MSMDESNRQGGPRIVCPQCGHQQAASGVECLRCGYPLQAPTQLYRREANGSWTVLKAIDLSSIAPKAPRLRRHVNWQRLAIIVALMVLPGIILAAWSRAMRVQGVRLEGVEIARYLQNPVGRITPRLEVQHQRDAEGTLQVDGRSNLPNKTVFDVRVYAGQDLVAIDYPVIIAGGRFETRPLLSKGKPFANAPYQLRITAVFDNRSQPASVLLVVGSLGERLQGPAVSHMPGTGAAKIEFVEEFVLGP
jgi:hypothetical protein